MRITTKLVIDMNSGSVLEHEFYEYEGPLELLGGGPDATQKAQESASANLANTQAEAGKQALAFTQAQQARVNPFYQNLMDKGDPNFNAETDNARGVIAQAYAPAKANLEKRLASYGNLPSGYADQARTDLNTQQAHDFDSQLTGLLGQNLALKQAGASGLLGTAQVLTPASLFGGANSANQTVMATPRSPGFAGLLSGIAQGAGSAAGGYFGK